MTAAPTPVVGDLWTLTPDVLSLLPNPPMLLITRTIDNYMLAVPATSSEALTGPPAVVVTDGPTGMPVHVLPIAETGLGLHVLGTRLGPLLDADTVTALRRHAEDGAPSPLPAAPGVYDADQVRLLVHVMQALCFHEPATQET